MTIRRHRPCEYVYLVFCEATGLYKIGTTVNPDGRLAQLQSTSLFPLKIAVLFKCNPFTGRTFESILHYGFESKRTHGEWFKLEKDAIDWLTSRSPLLSIHLELEYPQSIPPIETSIEQPKSDK